MYILMLRNKRIITQLGPNNSQQLGTMKNVHVEEA